MNGKNEKAWWLATIFFLMSVNVVCAYAQSRPAAQAQGSNVAGTATGGSAPTRTAPPAPASTLSDAARDRLRLNV